MPQAKTFWPPVSSFLVQLLLVNDESRLIPTLVYQLCLSVPALEDTIEQDPLVLSRSLEAQIHSLVVDPLRRALLNKKNAISLRSGPKPIIYGLS
jgi:hypothetical protein